MSGLLQIPDFSNGWVILRIMCGAFFVPHIYAKFYVPAALGFFVAAKFNPPKFWMYVAGAIEIVLALALIFGIFTTFTAAIAALHLMVAAVAVYRVSDGKWLWNIGGSEFCVFWAVCCALVAMQS